MLNLIESISLASGALYIALLCALIGLAVGAIRSTALAYISAVGSALIIATIVYWAPVLLGEESGELLGWFPLFFVIWFPSGALAAAIMVYLRRRFR